MGVAAFGDFIGNVAHLKQGRGVLMLSNKGADPAGTHEQTLKRHLADSSVDGHAGETQGASELVF